MTLPARPPGTTPPGPPDSVDAGAPDPNQRTELDPAPPAPPAHGWPGGRVVTLATLVVIGVAVAEASRQEQIGIWTTVSLLVVSVVAPVVTRPGDRSLPAMMPPLAFLAAVLIAGQLLLPQTDNSLRTRELVMIVQQLGPNALWVLGATVLSVTIAAIGHVIDRRIARRAAATDSTGSAS